MMIFIIVVAITLIIVGPIVTHWALTLLGVQLPEMSFWVWFAILWLSMVIGGRRADFGRRKNSR